MNPGRPEVRERLKAEAESVEDLVAEVMRGRVRTPVFQRGLKWRAQDVVDLFDSIFRGFPIGSLLFRRGHADAAQLGIGPLTIDAPETETALWTVDGQQRITALAVALGRSIASVTSNTKPDPSDPWVVWFDADKEQFLAPRTDGRVETTWVPLPVLGDPSRLGEWILAWSHGKDSTMRQRVWEASRRVREYRIPHYVVASNDDGALREIFFRINKTGKALKWSEVHDALFGSPGSIPSTLTELRDELAQLGVGKPTTEQLLQAVLATRGLDVTQSLDQHVRNDRTQLRGMVQDGLPALRRALDFLRRHARIAHLRLLPRTEPFLVVSRFFFLHQEPSTRTVELLTCWFWRVLIGDLATDERTFIRRAIRAVDDDEEESVQRLLALAPQKRPDHVSLPNAFDARKASSRLTAVALASLEPRVLESGARFEVAQLLERREADVFRRIFSPGPGHRSGVANRLLHPGRGRVRSAIELHVQANGDRTATLESHAITPDVARALMKGDVDTFLERRAKVIQETQQRLADRLAGWSNSTRPSIEHVVRRAGDGS